MAEIVQSVRGDKSLPYAIYKKPTLNVNVDRFKVKGWAKAINTDQK